jgi:hypothetical protein
LAPQRCCPRQSLQEQEADQLSEMQREGPKALRREEQTEEQKHRNICSVSPERGR